MTGDPHLAVDRPHAARRVTYISRNSPPPRSIRRRHCRHSVSAMKKRHLTEAEARFLATRDRILARRNPELLARENAEFEAMSDEELQAAAYGAPAEGGAPAMNLRRGLFRVWIALSTAWSLYWLLHALLEGESTTILFLSRCSVGFFYCWLAHSAHSFDAIFPWLLTGAAILVRWVIRGFGSNRAGR
jgi:hypothetical protein